MAEWSVEYLQAITELDTYINHHPEILEQIKSSPEIDELLRDRDIARTLAAIRSVIDKLRKTPKPEPYREYRVHLKSIRNKRIRKLLEKMYRVEEHVERDKRIKRYRSLLTALLVKLRRLLYKKLALFAKSEKEAVEEARRRAREILREIGLDLPGYDPVDTLVFVMTYKLERGIEVE